MTNMSYCRFQNTLSDLLDCQDALDENELSAEEASSRKALISTCVEIAESHGGEVRP